MLDPSAKPSHAALAASIVFFCGAVWGTYKAIDLRPQGELNVAEGKFIHPEMYGKKKMFPIVRLKSGYIICDIAKCKSIDNMIPSNANVILLIDEREKIYELKTQEKIFISRDEAQGSSDLYAISMWLFSAISLVLWKFLRNAKGGE